MARLNVSLDRGVVAIALDDPVPVADRVWGVVGVRVTDELTGRPPRSAITMATSTPRLLPRVAADGLVGLVGVPREVFPFLRTTNYTVPMEIQAPGFVSQHLLATLPADPGFPGRFTPLTLPDLALHRLPVTIRGRTVLAGAGATTPVSGAAVRISGVWRTLPPANIAVPPLAPNLVFLSPPISAGRSAGVGLLARCDLVPVAGVDKRLLAPRGAGDRALPVSDRLTLGVGGIIAIEAARPDRIEYGLIHSVTGGSTPQQEAEIELEYPLAFEHRTNALIQPAAPLAPGPNNTMAVGAIPGDSTVFLNGLAGLAPARQVLVQGGGVADEYHGVLGYQTVSDAGGSYRLPPISRVAQVQLEATDGVHAPVNIVVSPDYEQSENIIDLVFR